MSWFPELLKTIELLANLLRPSERSNHHGESIMIDLSRA
jgi:hypothetical protein